MHLFLAWIKFYQETITISATFVMLILIGVLMSPIAKDQELITVKVDSLGHRATITGNDLFINAKLVDGGLAQVYLPSKSYVLVGADVCIIKQTRFFWRQAKYEWFSSGTCPNEKCLALIARLDCIDLIVLNFRI